MSDGVDSSVAALLLKRHGNSRDIIPFVAMIFYIHVYIYDAKIQSYAKPDYRILIKSVCRWSAEAG